MKNRWSDRTPSYLRTTAIVLMILSIVIAMTIKYGGITIPPYLIVVVLLVIGSLVACFKLAHRVNLSSVFSSGISYHKENDFNVDRLLNIFTIMGCLSSSLLSIFVVLG